MKWAFHEGATERARNFPTVRLIDPARTRSVLRLTAPGITTEAAARKALGTLVRGHVRPSRYASIDGPPEFSTADWAETREWLLKWLPSIRGFDSASTRWKATVIAEINGALFMSNVQIQLGLSGLEYMKFKGSTTIESAALALVPFLMPGGWSPNRLAQCRYSNCSQWFLRPPPRRGTKAEYCKPSHATAERVTRFRLKRKLS